MTDDYYSLEARAMRKRSRPTNAPQIIGAQFDASASLQDRANKAGVSVEAQRAVEAYLAGRK